MKNDKYPKIVSKLIKKNEDKNNYPQIVTDHKLKLTKAMLDNFDIDRFNNMDIFYIPSNNDKYHCMQVYLDQVWCVIKGLQKCNS